MVEHNFEKPPEDLILRRAFELPRTRRKRLAAWQRWKHENWDHKHRSDSPTVAATASPVPPGGIEGVARNSTEELIEQSRTEMAAISDPDVRARGFAELAQAQAQRGNQEAARRLLAEADATLTSIQESGAITSAKSYIRSVKDSVAKPKFPTVPAESAEAYLSDYLEQTAIASNSIDSIQFARAATILIEAYRRGAWVFCCGNGGSAAIANQLQSDHVRNIRIGTHLTPRVMSLSASIELVTTIANDIAYENVFSYQLQSLASPGDVLISISSSGRSPNIVQAVAWAGEHGLRTITLTGFDGGAARAMTEVSLHVDAANYGIVQDLHQAVVHALGQYIRQSQMTVDEIATTAF